jgi:thiosulfate/3-mercaptopyruvate sulfurtransferase
MLPGPLVDGGWLLANADRPDLRVVDIQEPQLFRRHHVPGAINWPFDLWRSGADADPPKSLPPLDQLAAQLGQLGIAAETSVVIVDTGSSSGDLSASARVFWTLKVLGHEQVAVLDGGLSHYVNVHRGPFVSGAGKPREPVVYRPKPNRELLATADWLAGSSMPRLDARSLAEYVGVVSGPGERPGTLPGAKHLPYDWLTTGDGRLRPREQLDRLFEHADIADQGAVHFCHTGNRASLTWFVDYAIMGNHEARLYDASMIEWGKQVERPIETALDLGE